MTSTILLLSGADLRRVLPPKIAIDAIAEAYAQLADHRGDQGRSVGFSVESGSIHVKSGLLPGSRLAFASKVNVNLPENMKLHGLPTIQGVVVLVDAKDGRPLAILESIVLTGLRTAATAALAARYGARSESQSAAIIGCGAQAGFQLAAMRSVFGLKGIKVFDVDTKRAEAFAAANATASCMVTSVCSLREAVTGADICITCTTAKAPVLTDDLDLAGCFVAAIGADNPDKHEIAPGLMSRARILVDDLDACARGGDLNHALRSGAVCKVRVHADLAELASGRKQGRLTADELVVFDSSGSGVQDVAAAWASYHEAARMGAGQKFQLSGA